MNRRTFLGLVPLYAATWARASARPALAAVLSRLRALLESDRGPDTLWRRKHSMVAFGVREGDREAFEAAVTDGALRDDLPAEAHCGQFALALTYFPPDTRFGGRTAAQLVAAEAQTPKYRLAIETLRSIDVAALPETPEETQLLRNRLAKADLSWIAEALARTGGDPRPFLDVQLGYLDACRQVPRVNLVTEFGVHTLGALLAARHSAAPALARELLDRDWRNPRYPQHETSLAGHLMALVDVPPDVVELAAERVLSGELALRFGEAAHLYRGFETVRRKSLGVVP